MARWMRVFGLVAAVLWVSAGPQQAMAQSASTTSQQAKPLDPAAGILAAFGANDVVALDEGAHGNLQGAAFREKLYRDPGFEKVVGDIVVESGNARYQSIMDRYISGGEVPYKELRKAWLETTQPGPVWDKDIYGDAFRIIRDVNRILPKHRKLRVLLGDTPYPAESGDPERSDAFPANLVREEVLRKHRKVLIVFGGLHFLRRSKGGDFADTIVTKLEASGVRVFSIWTPVFSPDLTALQPDTASWAKPRLALLEGTPLGAAPFTFYYPKGLGRVLKEGVTTDFGEYIGGSMQDQFDALLYLGPRTEIRYAKLSASLCADPDYVAMRAARMNVNQTPGGRSATEGFKANCAAVLAAP